MPGKPALREGVRASTLADARKRHEAQLPVLLRPRSDPRVVLAECLSPLPLRARLDKPLNAERLCLGPRGLQFDDVELARCQKLGEDSELELIDLDVDAERNGKVRCLAVREGAIRVLASWYES